MPETVKKTEYDLVVLYSVDSEKAAESVEKLIATNGGEIVKTDDMGQKEMAYKIAGENFAKYVEYRVSLPNAAPAKISQVLNITEGVLRYLLTKVVVKAENWIAENKKAMEKRATERAANDAE